MILSDWINLEGFDNWQKLSAQFKNAKPFPHILLKNFLNSNIANTILEEIKKENFKEKESDLFQFKQTDDLHYSKNDLVKKFHASLLNWEFFNLITKITGLKLKGTLDMSATLYSSTDFLLCHDDKIDERKIAYILYLSKNFNKKDGGEFLLYDSKDNIPTTPKKTILPEFNSLLLFEVSKKSFHEVAEVTSNKKRYAIGGWLK